MADGGMTGGTGGAKGAAKGALMGGVAAGAVVLAAILYWVFGTKPPEAPGAGAPAAGVMSQGTGEAVQPAPEAAPAQSDTQTAKAAQGAAPAAPEPAAAPKPAAPKPATTEPAVPPAVASFDALRVSPEGEITLAGRAAPGAKVEVLLDGAVIDTVTANGQGAFASVVLGQPAAEARGLTVRVTGADGVAQVAGETLTVAPSALALAQAATAAGAAPEAVAAQVEAAQALAEKPLVTDAATGAARVLAGAAETLTIDTLAFDPDGTMALSGRGAPAGALLRAYVDNAEAGLVQAVSDGNWALRLPAPAAGAHSLRIDALDAAGKVLARAETPFESVAPAVLAQAAGAAGSLPPLPSGASALTAQAPGTGSGAPLANTAQEAAMAGTGSTGSGTATSGNAPATATAPTTATGQAAQIITISQGNTLWAIAREAYGDPYLYVRIFEANRDQIRDPDLIYPGQIFTVPN